MIKTVAVRYDASKFRPIEALKKDDAEQPTAIVPVTSIAGLQVDMLEKRVANYLIPKEKVDRITGLLAAERGNDKTAHGASVEARLAEYKAENSLIKRLLNWGEYRKLKRNMRNSAPPASERTEFLEKIVMLQEQILQGYGRFCEFPKFMKDTYDDYATRRARASEVEQNIARMEEESAEMPSKISACEELIGKLSGYAMLSGDEKEKVSLSVLEAIEESLAPSLENTAVRKRVWDKLSESIAQNQLNAMNYNANLELARQELSCLVEQQKMIEEQLDEISNDWLPAMKRVEEAKLWYDVSTRFDNVTEMAIGMNLLRQKIPVVINELQDAMEKVRRKVIESRLYAESVEEGAAEVAQLYAGRARQDEQEIEEVVEVSAEPAREKISK